jgi:acyl-CoA synthetase (NDP forming)
VGGDSTQIPVKMLEDNKISSYTTAERTVSAVNALTKCSRTVEKMNKEK